MFKPLLAFLFFSFFSLPVRADVFDHPLPDGMDLSKDIQTPVRFSGAFTQTKEMTDAGMTLTSKGRFAIDREKGILWETLSPFSNTVVIDGSTLCLNGKKLAASGPGNAAADMIQMIRNLIVLDVGSLSSAFDVFYLKQKNGTAVIGLVPTDVFLSSLFTKIEVVKGKRHVEKAVLYAPLDTTTIVFSSVVDAAEDFSCDP